MKPVLKGWGTCCRTGNSSEKFRPVDRHVSMRLGRLMGKLRRKRGQKKVPFRTQEWSHTNLVEAYP